MTPDTTIEQQARKEAEAKYPGNRPDFNPLRRDEVPISATALGHSVILTQREAYAAALIAERSKPQPSVDALMSCIDNYFGDSRFEVPWDILDRGELRDRLAKLFTHRP